MAQGTAEMRLFNPEQWSVDNAFLFTNYYSLAGDYFGENGKRSGKSNDWRTWNHPTAFGGSDSCIVNDGVNSKVDFNRNMNYLRNNYYVYQGYSVRTTIVDKNKWAVPGFGRKVGKW